MSPGSTIRVSERGRNLGVLLLGILAGCVGMPEETSGAGVDPLGGRYHSSRDLPDNIGMYVEAMHRGVMDKFQGSGGKWLSYTIQQGSGRDLAFDDTALVIVNGRCESYVMYAELFDDLRRLPMTIYSYDHRGQGLSDRVTADKDKGHVESFDRYVTDLEIFMDRIVAQGNHRRIYMMGHSMGGAIATLYAMKHPHQVDALVLISPMFELTLPYTEEQAYGLATSTNPERYAPTQGPFDPNERWETNTVIRDRRRWDMLKAIISPPYYPVARLGGVSCGWLAAAIEATRRIRAQPAQLLTPTLVIAAGDDKKVSIQAEARVCREARQCRAMAIRGAWHEILFDQDQPRALALSSMMSFFNERMW